MKATGWAAGLVLIFGLSACGGSDTADVTVMPDVVGQPLDAAQSRIKDAGFDDEVDVSGGGTFGIVDESNWKVCEQTPAGGKSISDTPKLTVDRSCDDESTTTTTKAADTATTAAPANLTAANNPELAALLAGSDCDESIAQFAAKYRGRNIEFDGNIAAMANHGSYDTRYDILIQAGDYNGATHLGPSFQFRNVNTTSDLRYTGEVPDTIGRGTNLHVVVKVGEYEGPRTCLFLIKPVSTAVR